VVRRLKHGAIETRLLLDWEALAAPSHQSYFSTTTGSDRGDGKRSKIANFVS